MRPLIAQDLAHDVRALLASGATYDGRPLEPRDVAVISYRHADLARSQEALHAVGVPAVIAGGGSVFATPAAVEWLRLLEGLEQPHRSARVRSAALTSFLGHTATRLDADGERLTEEVADRLRAWAEVYATRGVAAVLEAATADGLPGRVLGEVGGERHLTDLRHIGEALHEVGLTERLGVASMLAWLRRQVAEGRDGRGAERTRRLDSDAAAVQLVTIHASKGLQYPVVYLPALADRNVPKPSTPLFHDDDGRRCLDVGGGAGDGWRDHVARWEREEAGEWLRLLYVAVTRAQSQVVAWWAPTRNTPASPLHRMLQGRRPDTADVPDAFDNRTDDDAAGVFEQLARPRRTEPRAGRPGPAGRRRPAGAPDRPRGPHLRPRRRHRLAPYVVLLADPGRTGCRPGRRQRARGRCRATTRARCRSASRPADPGAGDPVADGRAAGRRRLRVAGPRRPRARRSRAPDQEATSPSSCARSSSTSWCAGRSTSTTTSWSPRWSR